MQDKWATRYQDSVVSFWIVAITLFWVTVSVVAMVHAGTVIGLALVVAPAAIYFLATRSWLRVAVVVGGGLLVLGATTDVGPSKILYFAAFLFCAVISAYRLTADPPTWIGPFRPVFIIGGVLLACLLLAVIANPVDDLTTVLRTSFLYLMIPIAPIIGIDAGRDAHGRTVMRWIAVIGTIAAIGFAADWLDRRGVSSLSFGRFVVSSLILPALAFALCLVRAAYSRGFARALWLAPVAIIPCAMLATGTRTNLVLFVALLGVLGTAAKLRVTPGKALVVVAVGAALITLIFPPLVNAVIAQPGFIEARMRLVLEAFGGGVASDQSFAMRNEQYFYTAQWISESPWFGKGPGFSPPIPLDTPLAIVLRIGLVGTVALVLFLGSLLLASRTSARQYGYTFMHTTVTGVGIVVIAVLPFGPVVEDRGFAFMLVLLTMGLTACIQNSVDASIRDPLELPVRMVDRMKIKSRV
jgi:hypothetical protein